MRRYIMKKKILITDDEEDLCEILKFNLETSGFQVETANNADEMLRKKLSGFDLFLLDIMMPGLSGLELAKQLKTNELTKSIPIIFITAKDTLEDTLTGFDLGADDYIKKPFSVKEVLARVKAVLNRTYEETNTLLFNGLVIDFIKKSVTADGVRAEVTKTEFDLLVFLLKNKGKHFNRKELMDAVWPENVIVTERTVDVNLTRLRKKIGRYSANIVARLGFGYTFLED